MKYIIVLDSHNEEMLKRLVDKFHDLQMDDVKYIDVGVQYFTEEGSQ